MHDQITVIDPNNNPVPLLLYFPLSLSLLLYANDDDGWIPLPLCDDDPITFGGAPAPVLWWPFTFGSWVTD